MNSTKNTSPRVMPEPFHGGVIIHDSYTKINPLLRKIVLAGILLWSGCASVNLSTMHPKFSAPAHPNHKTEEVVSLVNEIAPRYGLAPALILGMIHVESRFNPNARSSVGARGLMQLMPQTARSVASRMGRDSYDLEAPSDNIELGVAYLSEVL